MELYADAFLMINKSTKSSTSTQGREEVDQGGLEPGEVSEVIEETPRKRARKPAFADFLAMATSRPFWINFCIIAASKHPEIITIDLFHSFMRDSASQMISTYASLLSFHTYSRSKRSRYVADPYHESLAFDLIFTLTLAVSSQDGGLSREAIVQLRPIIEGFCAGYIFTNPNTLSAPTHARLLVAGGLLVSGILSERSFLAQWPALQAQVIKFLPSYRALVFLSCALTLVTEVNPAIPLWVIEPAPKSADAISVAFSEEHQVKTIITLRIHCTLLMAGFRSKWPIERFLTLTPSLNETKSRSLRSLIV